MPAICWGRRARNMRRRKQKIRKNHPFKGVVPMSRPTEPTYAIIGIQLEDAYAHSSIP
jgi:hypothetical protein